MGRGRPGSHRRDREYTQPGPAKGTDGQPNRATVSTPVDRATCPVSRWIPGAEAVRNRIPFSKGTTYSAVCRVDIALEMLGTSESISGGPGGIFECQQTCLWKVQQEVVQGHRIALSGWDAIVAIGSELCLACLYHCVDPRGETLGAEL